jgi:hypothetical protein
LYNTFIRGPHHGVGRRRRLRRLLPPPPPVADMSLAWIATSLGKRGGRSSSKHDVLGMMAASLGRDNASSTPEGAVPRPHLHSVHGRPSRRGYAAAGSHGVHSGSPPAAGLLLRDFMHRALYDRADGYFTQPQAGAYTPSLFSST